MILFLNFIVSFMTCLCHRNSLDVGSREKNYCPVLVPHSQKVIFL